MTDLVVTSVDDGQVLAVSKARAGLAGIARAVTRDDVEIIVDRGTHGLLSLSFETDGRAAAPPLLGPGVSLDRVKVGDRWGVPWRIDAGDGLAVVGADSIAGLAAEHPTTQLNIAELTRLSPRVGGLLQLPPAAFPDPTWALMVSEVSPSAARRAMGLRPEPAWKGHFDAVIKAHAEATETEKSAGDTTPDQRSTARDHHLVTGHAASHAEPGSAATPSAPAGASVAIESHWDAVQKSLPPGEDIPVLIAWSCPPEELPGLVVASARRCGTHTAVALGPAVSAPAASEPLWARMWDADGALLGIAAFAPGTGTTLTAVLPTWPEAEWIDVVRDPSQPPDRKRATQRSLGQHARALLHSSRLAHLADAATIDGEAAFLEQVRAVCDAGGLDPAVIDRLSKRHGWGSGPPATALLGDLLDADDPDNLAPGVSPALGTRRPHGRGATWARDLG